MIHEFDTLDSTQNKAKELIESNQAHIGDIIWCHQQTAGRGRGNNQWHAQAGATLTYTLIGPSIEAGYPPLSLIVGSLLAQQFNQLNQTSESIQIKWPNDLYYQGKKLGGILIENNASYSLIGVGINIKTTSILQSLQATALDALNINQIYASTPNLALNQVLQALKPIVEPSPNWSKIWQNSYHYLQANQLYLNQLVQMNCAEQETQGIIRGIDQQGYLLLETKQGIESIVQASNIRSLSN